MTNFVSVSTSAARYQDLSLNPQKLAGQCAKLKCCLNYETDIYVEAQRDIPSKDIILDSKECSYYLFKADIFKRQMTYSTSKDFLANAVTIPVERAKQIIALNKKGIRVDNLSDVIEIEQKSEFGDVLSQDGLTRFDHSKKPGKNKGNKDRHRTDRPEKANETERSARPDRPERSERIAKPERMERPAQLAQEKRPDFHKKPEGQNTEKDQKSNNANRQQHPNNNHKKEARNKNRNQQNKPHFEKPQKPDSANNDNPKNEAK